MPAVRGALSLGRPVRLLLRLRGPERSRAGGSEEASGRGPAFLPRPGRPAAPEAPSLDREGQPGKTQRAHGRAPGRAGPGSGERPGLRGLRWLRGLASGLRRPSGAPSGRRTVQPPPPAAPRARAPRLPQAEERGQRWGRRPGRPDGEAPALPTAEDGYGHSG